MTVAPGHHVLVMAKAPVPGRVKTRLCPPCSPEQAAVLATAALSDTLEAVAACGAERKIVALDGDPGPWLPAGFEVVVQRGATLAERLGHAWHDTGGPGLQVGMDTPQVTPAELDRLLAVLEGPGRPAVIGHAVDGGWWVIGLRHVDPAAAFVDIPMSKAITGRLQERRLRQLGLDVVHAPVRRDIDTVSDLVAVAAIAPSTRTAGTARALGLVRRVA